MIGTRNHYIHAYQRTLRAPSRTHRTDRLNGGHNEVIHPDDLFDAAVLGKLLVAEDGSAPIANPAAR